MLSSIATLITTLYYTVRDDEAYQPKLAFHYIAGILLHKADFTMVNYSNSVTYTSLLVYLRDVK